MILVSDDWLKSFQTKNAKTEWHGEIKDWLGYYEQLKSLIEVDQVIEIGPCLRYKKRRACPAFKKITYLVCLQY